MATKKIFWLIFLFTFTIRLIGIDKLAVYPDEITWMVKGKEALYALKALNLEYFRHGWWNSLTDTYAIGWPMVILGGLFHIIFAGAGKFSLHLLPDILSVRLPEIFISSFIPSILFYYASVFIKQEVALFAAVALSLSPISLGVDRWFIHDSFLSLFFLLSLGSYLKAHKEKKISILPGIWLALAALTKPLGIIPLIGWLILFNRKLFIANLISCAVLIQLIWPQSWIEPIVAYPNYLLRQLTLVNTGDPIPNFYFGVSSNSPHWSYYFYELLIRTPELILISFFLGFVLLISKLKNKLVLSVLIPISICLYLLSTSSVKGGIRYLVFALPLIYLISAQAIYLFLKKIKTHRPLVYLLLLIHLGLVAYSFYPDYYLYYNALSGGGEKQKKYILISLCYGNRSALEYLDQNKYQGPAFIFGCQDSGFYHTSRKLTKTFKDAKYLIVESSFVQQHPDNQQLLQTLNFYKLIDLRQKGIVTASIYQNPIYGQPESPPAQ